MSQAHNLNYTNNFIQRYSDVDLFSMQGRMGRKRYFVLSIILPVITFWVISTIASLASQIPVASHAIYNASIAIAIFATMITMVYITIQRSHDFNKSSALALLAIIPFANIIFAMIPGTNGLNSYGEVPLPGNWLYKVSFYALIALLFGIVIYVSSQFL